MFERRSLEICCLKGSKLLASVTVFGNYLFERPYWENTCLNASISKLLLGMRSFGKHLFEGRFLETTCFKGCNWKLHIPIMAFGSYLYKLEDWETTTMVIIFRDFYIFYQVFCSPEGKRSAIISEKNGRYELCRQLPNDPRFFPRILGN